MTGLHIGAGKETIEIGGIDNMVLRDSVTRHPFIPGSSLKGKMRTLLELSDPEAIKNVVDSRGDPCKCGTCLPCKIFGVSASNNSDKEKTSDRKGPTKLIVRDSYPTEDTLKMWEELREIGDVVRGAELKYENTINRITSVANPRPMERVPKDSEFSFEMVFSIFDKGDRENIKGVFAAMKLLEDNYIGGSGTRGYGKIKFRRISIVRRRVGYYKGTEDQKEVVGPIDDINEILNNTELFNQR